MKNFPTDETGTVVYAFTSPPKGQEPEDLTTPQGPKPALEEYLQYLLGRGSITHQEDKVLRQALTPLYDRFLRLSTISTVQDDIRKAGSVPALRRQEMLSWQGKESITDFDLDKALDLFYVLRKNDPQKTLRGITQEIDASLDEVSYIPPYLYRAELFFWVILRMCRLQHETEQHQETSKPLDAVEVAADAFLNGEISVGLAVSMVQDHLPPPSASNNNSLLSETQNAIKEADQVLEVETKRTGRWKKLLRAIKDELTGHSRWRRLAIETRHN